VAGVVEVPGLDAVEVDDRADLVHRGLVCVRAQVVAGDEEVAGVQRDADAVGGESLHPVRQVGGFVADLGAGAGHVLDEQLHVVGRALERLADALLDAVEGEVLPGALV
jgi:hypothetical protein